MYYSLGLDTNVLFSGLYFKGAAHALLQMALQRQADFFLSQYVFDESFDVISRKRLSSAPLEKFLQLPNVKAISDSSYASSSLFSEGKALVRDRKDIPVFAFAAYSLRNNSIDYFISGDKDLLTAGVRKALSFKILTVKEFEDARLR